MWDICTCIGKHFTTLNIKEEEEEDIAIGVNYGGVLSMSWYKLCVMPKHASQE
jgi:hypothetical protein